MRQKQDLLSQSLETKNASRLALCSASNLRAREKRKRTTVQADSQGHVSHYHELMSRVWPVNAYFLMRCPKKDSWYQEIQRQVKNVIGRHYVIMATPMSLKHGLYHFFISI